MPYGTLPRTPHLEELIVLQGTSGLENSQHTHSLGYALTSTHTRSTGPLSLLGGIAHAQHAVGEVPVIPKSAVGAQELLVVPGLEELLQEVVPV